MEQVKKILIVDDTELNRVILEDILEGSYSILQATNGLEALDVLRHQNSEIGLVLLDINMPMLDGFGVLEAMKENEWLQSVPVIMISAEAAPKFMERAYEMGATDYIIRPFDEKIVQHRVGNTIMLYTKQRMLENMITEQIMEKERSNSQMVEILSNIVEFRNGESGLHVLHVRLITDMLLQAIAQKMPQYGLNAERIALISNASAMHDIGKISIDEKILNKPGRLTDEEYTIMKQHTVIGAQMLEEAAQQTDAGELVKIARDICRWHHERYDGRGYPDGLRGDEIPIHAQVVALADVYDALTSKRVYKPPYPHEQAIAMIQNNECGVFNPLLLDCLLECSEKLQQMLTENSSEAAAELETRQIMSELLAHDELKLSSQTMTMLEQEREKNRFFMARARESLFEYDFVSQTLTLSDHAAAKFGLPKSISRPAENETLKELAGELLGCLRELAEKTNPVSPQVEQSCLFRLPEGPRQLNVILYVLWDIGDAPSYSRIIGEIEEDVEG